VIQVIDAYEKASGIKISFKVVSKRLGDIASCYAASDKAKKIPARKVDRSIYKICESSYFFQRRLNCSY